MTTPKEALILFMQAYKRFNERKEGGEDDLHHAAKVAEDALDPEDLVFEDDDEDDEAVFDDEVECQACNDGSCPWCEEEKAQRSK